MSMIEQQIKKLRELADCYYGEIRHHVSEILQAADTIEALSAKLAKGNYGRSEMYYNGGWILCCEQLPEEGEKVLLQDYYENIEIGRFGHDENYQNGFYSGDWFSTANNYLEWMPKPELYKPK